MVSALNWRQGASEMAKINFKKGMVIPVYPIRIWYD